MSERWCENCGLSFSYVPLGVGLCVGCWNTESTKAVKGAMAVVEAQAAQHAACVELLEFIDTRDGSAATVDQLVAVLTPIAAATRAVMKEIT